MPRSPDSDTKKKTTTHRSPFSWREEPNSYHVHDQVSAGVALVCRLLETRILQQRKHKYGLLTDFLTIGPLNSSTVSTLGQIPGHLGGWTKTISTVCCSNICFSDIFSDLVTKSVQCSLFWVYFKKYYVGKYQWEQCTRTGLAEYICIYHHFIQRAKPEQI